MSDRTAFLKAIEDHPEDDGPRLVYADWLDERGEVDEADRQRAWRNAYDWLCQEFVRGCWYPETDEQLTVPVALRYIVGWAEQMRDHGEVCFNHDDAPQKFWGQPNTSYRFINSLWIVTGIRLDLGRADEAGYRCAC